MFMIHNLPEERQNSYWDSFLVLLWLWCCGPVIESPFYWCSMEYGRDSSDIQHEQSTGRKYINSEYRMDVLRPQHEVLIPDDLSLSAR